MYHKDKVVWTIALVIILVGVIVGAWNFALMGLGLLFGWGIVVTLEERKK